MTRYDFNGLFSLESNTPYFEGMLHTFRTPRDVPKSTSQDCPVAPHLPPPFSFEFILDPKLDIDVKGKERINLMLFHNRDDESIEFSYPWLKSISAKLEFLESGFRFTFNKNYMRFSNVVAEGWELIDVFRSTLLSFLVRNKMYMFHAAAVCSADEGILLPAWGNTGKTSTSWMLAKNGYEFLTDEFAIVDRDGYCYGLPCSSLVSGKTAERFGAKLTSRDRLSIFISDAKSKLLSSRFAPGGIKINPDSLFKVCHNAKITRLAIIENGPDSIRSIDRHEAMLKIKSIQDYEFGWKSNPFLLAKSYFSGFDVDSLAAVENSFIEEFLTDLKEIRVVSSSNGEQYNAIRRSAANSSTIPNIAPPEGIART